jgi:hypothetical protein
MMLYSKTTLIIATVFLLLLNPITGNSQTTKKVSEWIETLTQSQSATPKEMNPKVMQLALKARDKAHKMGVAKKPLLTVIDYSLPSTHKRMWVMDMNTKKVLYHTHVAHGSGSGMNMAEKFSDRPGSNQSSIGVYVTGDTYQGNHGFSLNLHGLEKGINGNALSRRIVVHAADYVGEHVIKNKGRLGRSWGCMALNNKVAHPIIRTIKDGSLIFAYYPDNKWLKKSEFLS